MDTPQQRTININGKMIGLLGLDVALNQLLDKDISEDAAVAFLFNAVERQNYIPAKAASDYRQALRQEYRKLRHKDPAPARDLTIRILGPACVTCNKIMTMVINILQDKGLAADVENIHELDEIWRYGVTKTPALIINGQVKSAGIQPTITQVEQWLTEAGKEI